jgi:hypothetical protein|tara:strand:- start:204 stop:989 length:786 start_codon:yes stop_codon:yes gene_type:complete
MPNEIKWVDINSITPYEKNPRKNNDAVGPVANSIKEFGFNQPIVVDNDNIIVVGHTRHKAAKKLKMKTVPILTLPADMEENKIKAYRIADNRVSEFAEWDEEMLIEELKSLQADDYNVDMSGFSEDFILSQSEQEQDRYTKKIDTPIYTPKGSKPMLDNLFDDSRTQSLLLDIEVSTVPDDIKSFLKLGAHRHTKFNYSRIAEYYCHADADVQKLMEDSALVIIDFEKAIDLGYAQLRDDVVDIYKQALENGNDWVSIDDE